MNANKQRMINLITKAYGQGKLSQAQYHYKLLPFYEKRTELK